MVSELLEEAGVDVAARIFATDLDEDAVVFARRGVFPARALGEIRPEIVEKHFVQVGDEFEIRKHIRSMLLFGEHDLARRAPFPRIDMILCRNVLIYFTLPLQRRALELFAFSLRNGGYLVLGKSETISPLGEHFAPDQTSLKVFRRVGTRSQILRSRIDDVMPLASARIPLPARRSTSLTARLQAGDGPEPVEMSGPSRDEEGVLYGLPFGVVVVDRDYDIHYINTQARRLFGIHATAVGQDLIHLVQRFNPIEIRRIIDASVQGEEPSAHVLSSSEGDGDDVQSIEITCRAIEEERSDVVLRVHDVTERELTRKRLVAVEDSSSRLMKANEEVLAENHRLARTISVLRDEHEQIEVASAEIQAAIEEVETLNEELQASNEELQATIEELNTTNDDLEARSLEMQAMAIAAEGARHKLRGILDAVADAVIVVDEHESVVLQSQAVAEIAGDGTDPPDFFDLSGTLLASEESPLARVARGQDFATTLKVRGQDGELRTYEFLGRPTSISMGPRLGVLTIRQCP